MKKLGRLTLSGIILLLAVVILPGCYSSRKTQSELRGLMLQDNLKLPRNREFYSRHNEKAKRDAYRKYQKNSRYR